MRKRDNETAIEFMRRMLAWLDTEEESLLSALPSTQAVLDYAELWAVYDTELLTGILDTIREGADPAALFAFIEKYKLNWTVPPECGVPRVSHAPLDLCADPAPAPRQRCPINHGENARLFDAAIADGKTFFRDDNYQYMKNTDGSFYGWPVGFITGPQFCNNGNPRPFQLSVNGTNGWHQRSGTLAEVEGLVAWAVETQKRILAGIEQPQ